MSEREDCKRELDECLTRLQKAGLSLDSHAWDCRTEDEHRALGSAQSLDLRLRDWDRLGFWG
jgi:hypothetical protein